MSVGSQPRRAFWSAKASPRSAFRVVLAGLMASTAVGVVFAVTQRPRFVAAFPGAERLPVYAGLLTVAAVGLVALVGLWSCRRWAVALYAGAAIASLALDVAARAPALHQAAVLIGATAVLSLAYANRRSFGRDQMS